MTGSDRRTVLKATGASLGFALVAGCLGDDDDGDGDGNDGTDGETYEMEAGEQILFDGETSGGFIGVAPDSIAGVANPTLVLEAGADYEIGWRQGDGSSHNVVIWDENEEVVGDYETDLTNDPGDGDYVEFTASDEMAYYRCDPHPAMQGRIEVQ